MAGIYIHIPFCRKACHYCNFHFSTSLQNAPVVLKAIEKEIEMRSAEVEEPIKTIYFGGGTPSLIDTNAIGSILAQVSKYFTIHTDAEITLEANPDDITVEKANDWKSIGINRFSIGIQSFADDADAGTGGLTAGQMYQTDGTGAAPLNVAGIVMIKQ